MDETSEARLEGLAAVPAVGRAVEHTRASDERTLAWQVDLSEIPAPPFQEAARGVRMAALMRELGLESVTTDDEGNVLGWLGGANGGPPLVVSAHLDTVFPAGTDVSVTRDGELLTGPGISDDARGLAVLLALAAALRREDVRLQAPLLFAATVGEEGPGDLRGVKHLFSAGGAGRGALGFVSIDGAGLDRLVVRGLGATRYRVTVGGPGGHSWVDWGTANPIHALAPALAELVGLGWSREPLTTLTVARWGGGTSINAIPQEAWIEIDTRSESEAHLTDVEQQLRAVFARHFDSAPGTLELEIERIGKRPGGATPEDAPLVRAAVAATLRVGGTPQLVTSSTDANIPMAAGIPSITLGGGGEAGQAHTTSEWYRNVRGPTGVERALYLVLLAAGLAG